MRREETEYSSYDIESTVKVQVCGSLIKGFAPYFDAGMGNYQPGDPDTLCGFKVLFGSLDITKLLTQEEYHRLREEMFEHLTEGR